MQIIKDGQCFILDKNIVQKEYLCIKDGLCNVYLSKISNGKPLGKRYFLFELHSKDIIFSLPTVDDWAIIVVPIMDTLLDDTPILDDTSLILKKKTMFKAMASSLQWSKFQIDSFVNSFSNSTLQDFLNEYTSNVIDLVEKSNNKRLQNNKISLEKNKNIYYKSFDVLSNVLKNKREKELSLNNTDSIEDNLFKVCKMITQYLKMQIKVPLYLDKGFKVNNPLEEIAFASHFRVRKVTLSNGWHKNPTIPYVAYLKDTNTPIALIPTLLGYNMYNPEKNVIVKVNSSIASTIDLNRCHIIYRSLPSGTVTTKDLIKFCLNGIRKFDFIVMILVGIIGGLLSAISPLIISWIFDSVIPDANENLLKQLACILISITCVQFIFEIVRSFTIMRLENFFEMDLQSSLWDRLLSLPTTFFKEHSSGELAKKIDGISQIREIISGRVINQILSFIFGLFYIIVMFSINSRLSLLALIVIMLIAIISIVFGLGEIKYYKDATNLSAELSGKMISWLNGIVKIRTSGSESRVYNLWAKQFTKIRELDINRTRIHNISQIFCSVISVIVSMCMYFYIVNSTNLHLETGMFVAFNTALMVVLSNFISVTTTITDLNSVVPLYRNVKPIFETSPEYDETKEDIGEITGDIEVSHVSFRYAKDTPLVLKDISFNVKQGEHIALVGTSGSGKSTILRVLLGFEKSESGQIYFNGKDISQFNIRSLRKQLGVVLQSGQLLPGSIFENVVGSSNTLTIEDVENALAQAGILDEIKEMPMGIHTVVSEDFGTISGGQKQRILIARALISKPKVLFFDEATSALDNKTQKIVSDSINKLNITRITIAHRLSTITECDRIIVLDDGKIVEQGTYNQLLEVKGIFYNMVQRQLV